MVHLIQLNAPVAIHTEFESINHGARKKKYGHPHGIESMWSSLSDSWNDSQTSLYCVIRTATIWITQLKMMRSHEKCKHKIPTIKGFKI